jgi:hypothetical protein
MRIDVENLSREQVIALKAAVSALLEQYLPVYCLVWKGKGPMPHLGVGNVLSKTENSYTVKLTGEEMAWLADDWAFNSDWEMT